MSKKQNEAQRLADELKFRNGINTAEMQAAALLIRQDELLLHALEALEASFPIVQHERFAQDASYGGNFSQTKADRARTAHSKVKETITTIRAHREAK